MYVPLIVVAVVVVYNKGLQKSCETTREIWRSEAELQSLIIAEDHTRNGDKICPVLTKSIKAENDQVFPLIVANCLLPQQITFYLLIFFLCLFSILRNSQLESDVRRLA